MFSYFELFTPGIVELLQRAIPVPETRGLLDASQMLLHFQFQSFPWNACISDNHSAGWCSPERFVVLPNHSTSREWLFNMYCIKNLGNVEMKERCPLNDVFLPLLLTPSRESWDSIKSQTRKQSFHAGNNGEAIGDVVDRKQQARQRSSTIMTLTRL